MPCRAGGERRTSPQLFVEKISMCAGTDKHDKTRFSASIEIVGEQEVTANMAFPMTRPVTLERVVEPFRSERAVVCYEQKHRLL